MLTAQVHGSVSYLSETEGDKVLHPPVPILSTLSNLRDDPKTLLAIYFFLPSGTLIRSIFLRSFTCLGCASWVHWSADGARKQFLSAGCSPHLATLPGTSLPSLEKQVQQPPKQMLQEMTGQGNPCCGYAKVGCGTGGRQEDALGCPGKKLTWQRRPGSGRGKSTGVSHIQLRFPHRSQDLSNP